MVMQLRQEASLLRRDKPCETIFLVTAAWSCRSRTDRPADIPAEAPARAMVRSFLAFPYNASMYLDEDLLAGALADVLTEQVFHVVTEIGNETVLLKQDSSGTELGPESR